MQRLAHRQSMAFLGMMRQEAPLPEKVYYDLKDKIHAKLTESLNLANLSGIEDEVLRNEIKKMIEILVESERTLLTAHEKDRLIGDIQDEILGIGPLEPLLKDRSISEIMVNTHKQVYVERFGKLERVESHFKDDDHLRRIIDKIVSNIGRRIDESSPMVDARLPDGSRVNATIPPLAIDGPILTIRRFAADPLKLQDLILLKTLTPEIGEVLKGIARARLNIMISGGTGSGKTTLLNVLSGFIPASDRIITIEDAAELQLQQEHVVRLETRPPNIEGKGQVTQRDLVRNTLRMRPDRIILGEVRSVEALDMLQAMNTGHDGSLTTIHANTPRDALLRLETMVAMAGLNLPTKAMRHYISAAINIIIQVSRLCDGSRKLTSLQEVTGMEGDMITLQEIFCFEQLDVDANGLIRGRFRSTGIRPKFAERLRTMGIGFPTELFEQRVLLPD